MARPRKAVIEGAQVITQDMAAIIGEVGKDQGNALLVAVSAFKAHHPQEWNDLRLCPLQHGLDEMIRLLG